MKLKYPATQYEFAFNTLETIPPTKVGSYRGAPNQLKHLIATTGFHSVVHLTYRGLPPIQSF